MSDRLTIQGNGHNPIAETAGDGNGAAGPILGPEFVMPRGGPSEEESQLHHYWQLLYSRRWLLLATTLLGLTVAAFYTFRQPRLYVAQATVEFKKALPPSKNLDLDSLGRAASVPPELATRLLTTKILAARVITAERAHGVTWFDPRTTGEAPRSLLGATLGNLRSAVANVMATARLMVAPKPPKPEDLTQTPEASQPDTWEGVSLDTIGRYYGGIAVAPVRGTSLVDLRVTDTDPHLAAHIANTHVQAFVAMDAETKVASLSDAQGLLGRQLKEVREQLDASRSALTDYQIKHGMFNLPKDTGTLSRQSLQQLNTLLTQAQGERILAEAAYRNASSLNPMQLSATLPDAGLQTLRDQILSVEAQYQANLKDFGPNHPDMLALRTRIEALQEQLKKAAGQARERLQAALEAAQAKESQLHTDLEKLSTSASQEDRDLVQLSVLQRDAESNGQLYASLLDQAKSVNLAGAYEWTNVAIIDRAVAPGGPSFPNTNQNLIKGMIFGLFLGLLVCFLLDRLDTTINTPEELVNRLDLPAFGVIPDFLRLTNGAAYGRPLVPSEQLAGTGRELITLLHPASLVSEAYRAVRTNLMFASPDSPPKTILVTSSQAGEGKSVTTINLAITLTLSGARVLVIDGDLRKPSVHGLLRVKRDPGLSNVLTGQIGVDDAILRSPLCPIARDTTNGGGLFVLPAGRVPPNPAELLGSQRMTTLLATLREQYDFVLVDSPPIIPVTDSIVLATKADGVLMVVRGGVWSRDVVRKALWQLDSVHGNVLGGLLNMVNISSGRYYYYYRQQYHGYRGYGNRNGHAYGHAYGHAPETDDGGTAV